ncbi:hypothetical protein QR64_02795 [Rhodococcus sp. Chr-9]|nr:hypothetical protein [Rhodococcus sp. Chr-9]KHJ74135.1 hypothetical protein QR64_02795 [Rhodococcus sp. Chr-9]
MVQSRLPGISGEFLVFQHVRDVQCFDVTGLRVGVLPACERMCCVAQLMDGWCEFVGDDTAVVEPELAEAGGVEVASSILGRAQVERLRVVEQVEVLLELAGTEFELVAGVVEALLRAGAFDLDLAQPCADLVGRELTVRGEIDQSLLLLGELVELLAVGGVQVTDTSLRISHRDVDGLANVVQELRWQSELGVVVEDVPLNVEHRQMREIAFTALAGQTQVVGVVAAVAFRLGVDQSRDATVDAAALAVQQALEVVVEHAVTLSSGGAVFDDLLDALEQVGGDDRLVSTREDFALVADDADVVRVAQHPVQV